MIGAAATTRNLVKRRGRHRALDGFSLSVPRGSVTGLVGENGAGKTTWMMTLAGFLRPDSGEIDLLGAGPFDAAIHAGRIAILPQDSELPLESTLEGALYRFGRIQGALRRFCTQKRIGRIVGGKPPRQSEGSGPYAFARYAKTCDGGAVFCRKSRNRAARRATERS